MPDYPKLSVWRDAYYMTIRRFTAGGSWMGPAACALDRTKMIAGDPTASMVMFLLPSSSEGPLSLDCDSEFPPAGTNNQVCYLVSSPPQLNMYDFHVDWANTGNCTFNLGTSIPITAFGTLGGTVVPQPGTAAKLDAFSRKGLMFRMPFRKFNGYWSALASFTVSSSGKGAIRWMELRNTGSGWSLYQEGTYQPDNLVYRWMPSISIDTAGSIALGYSVSSTSVYPSLRYTGRLKNDALGTMTIAEKGIINGGGSQTDASGRWGDYSAMVTDPSAPGTFWFTSEYMGSTSAATWQTRIASFSIGNAFASYTTANPLTLCAGSDSIKLKAVAYGGSGTYTYSWTSLPAGFTSNLKEPKASPVQDTKYVCAISDGVKTNHDTTLLVKVYGAPSTTAGNDTVVDPTTLTIDLHGVQSNCRQTQWQTSGNGHFGSASLLNTTYTFGSLDYTNKSVLLILVGLATPPCTGATYDTMGVYLWATGINDKSVNKINITVQPNPARENVSITIGGLENRSSELTLLNLQGQMVYSTTLAPSPDAVTKQINVGTFPKGMYLVRVKSDKAVETRQLVVQ